MQEHPLYSRSDQALSRRTVLKRINTRASKFSWCTVAILDMSRVTIPTHFPKFHAARQQQSTHFDNKLEVKKSQEEYKQLRYDSLGAL